MRTSTAAARRSAAVTGVVVASLLWAVLTSLPANGEPGFSRPAAMAFAPGSDHSVGVLYQGLACAAVASCTAVGIATTPGGATLLEADRDVNGAWRSPTTLRYPGDANQHWYADELHAVACTSPGDCMAVGSFAAAPGNAIEPLMVQESAGTWAQGVALTTLPPNSNAGQFENADLDQVWCSSPGNCLLLGTYVTTTSQFMSFAVLETAGVLSPAVELPAPSNLADGGSVGATLALSCSATTRCLAVATYASNVTHHPGVYAIAETAGSWGTPVSYVPGGSAEAFVDDAGCVAVSTCVAGGYLDRPPIGASPYVVTFRAGRWRQPTVLAMPRLTPILRGGSIGAVGCATPTRCVVAGSLLGAERDGAAAGGAPAAYTWSSGAWSSANLLDAAPSGGPPAFDTAFEDVTCPAASSCEALGLAFPTAADNAPRVPFATTIIPVEPLTSPGPPVGLRARVVGASVVVTWSPPRSDGGAPVLRYHVTRSGMGGAATCSTATPRCVLGGVVRGRRYELTVTDRTAAGRTSAPARVTVVAPR